MDPLADLVERWRREADVLRRRGAPRRADVLEGCAEELEAAAAGRPLEPLTVEQAAALGGYSESRLRSLLSEETIANVGEPGAPRIRRCDVPRKPGVGPPRENGGSVAERALREVET